MPILTFLFYFLIEIVDVDCVVGRILHLLSLYFNRQPNHVLLTYVRMLTMFVGVVNKFWAWFELRLERSHIMASSSRPTSAAVTAAQAQERTHVTVVCQRCSKPIKLNRTLKAEVLRALASKKVPKWPSERTPSEPDVDKSTITEPRMDRRRSDAFGSLPSTITREDAEIYVKDIQMATESLRLLSATSDIDHPMCTVCPEAALEYYQLEMRSEEDAHQRYQRVIDNLQEQDASEEESLDSELAGLREEKAKLEAELEKLHKQSEEMSEQLAEEKKREKVLAKQESEYWEEFNEHQRQMLELRDQQTGIDLQMQYTQDQLSRLKRTSVLNTAFHIWHNGHFATINGLRFGRLPNVLVDWTEINAAWGQTTLLMCTLENLCGINFKRFKLIPYGSQSFVHTVEGKKRNLPLYTSSRLLVSDARFDSGMTAFLDCLRQFKEYVESASNGRFMLPYKILDDRIGEGQEMYSIRIQLNSEERWTKALKFVLTNLRWGMTWVSSNSLAGAEKQ